MSQAISILYKKEEDKDCIEDDDVDGPSLNPHTIPFNLFPLVPRIKRFYKVPLFVGSMKNVGSLRQFARTICPEPSQSFIRKKKAKIA